MAKKARIGLAVLALLVVGGAIAFSVRPSGAPRSEVQVALRAQLDAHTADIAVQLQQADWCEPWVTSCELRCTANVFGMDPRQAATVAAVTTVYAVMDCSDTDSAGIDTESIDIVAISFGPPPTMRGPPDDATQRDIARVFPVHARAAAWWFYTQASTREQRVMGLMRVGRSRKQCCFACRISVRGHIIYRDAGVFSDYRGRG